MKLSLLFILFASFLFASIGTISSVRGSVKITSAGKTYKGVIGTKISKGDVVKTGRRAKIQVILDDKTVITIGRNSEFNVEKYFFEKGNAKSNVKLNYKKGFFKTITGKIGKISPKHFNIKTKNSTIGIRGTHLVSVINPVKGIETTACTLGRIVVTSDLTGDTVSVPAGNMVPVSATKGLGKVQKFTAKAQAKMNAGFKGKKSKKKKSKPQTKQTKQNKKKAKQENKKSKKQAKQENKSSAKEKQESKSKGVETKSSEEKTSTKSEETTQESTGEETQQEDSTKEDNNQEPATQEEPAKTETVVTEEPEQASIDTPDAVEVSEPADVDVELDLDVEVDTSVVEDAVANDIQQAVTDEITKTIVDDVQTATQEVTTDPVSSTTFETIPETTTPAVPTFSPF